MVRPLFVFFGFVLLLLGPAACAAKPEAPPTASVSKTVEQARHPVFMWRTQSNTATVYLLGSIHVGTKEMYPLDQRIERAFAAADTLVLEIDLDEDAEAEAALAFVEMALLPKDQELDDVLDAETSQLLHQRLDDLGLSYDNVKMFRPWFVGLTISMQEMEEDGYTGEYGIDNHFRRQAVEAKKEILELESVKEQAAIFATLTSDAESDDLKMVLEDDGEEADLAPLTQQWLRGETRLIEEEVEETRSEYPDAYEALYAGRNHKMVEKIVGYLRTSKTYFVVAGSAHMVGEEGIVALLERRGYTVEQQ